MNRIPRNFKSITATVLTGNARGRRMIITKDGYGYHGLDDKGTSWALFVSQLRNDNFFKIENIEK